MDDYLERKAAEQHLSRTKIVSQEDGLSGIEGLLVAVWGLGFSVMPICGTVIVLLTVLSFLRLKWMTA